MNYYDNNSEVIMKDHKIYIIQKYFQMLNTGFKLF